MAIVCSPALVLSRLPFGNTSWVARFLTPDAGVVETLAKGARRVGRKSSFEKHLDLFTVGEIVYYEARAGLAQLTEYACLEDFRGIRAREDRLGAGFVILELLQQVAQVGEVHHGLYEPACAALRRLNASVRPRMELLAFWTRLLSIAGFGPDFAHCAACGGALGAGRGAPAYVMARSGGLVCADCARRDPRRRALPRAAFALWPALADAGGIDPARLRLAPQVATAFVGVLHAYTQLLLGAPLRSVALGTPG